ncbi:MAG: leucine-rich repeat protein [Oscillospiraceae bacterium]
MKKFLATALALMMAVGTVAIELPVNSTGANESYWLTGIKASADVLTSGNYSYTVFDDGTVSIYGYSGSPSELEIPSKLDGKTVTGINDGAFYGFQSLTSVTIPASVTSIGIWAFEYCLSLTSIHVDASNTMYTTVDGALYNKNQTELICCPAGKTSFTFPGSVTSIGRYAFEYCTNLTSVSIPSGVTSIGHGAFTCCTGLNNIIIPPSVKNIENYAFSYCSSLSNIFILSGVTSIGMLAFEECDSLTSITIPASVTSIGNGAFGYKHDANYDYVKVDVFNINCYSGSAAEQYAIENGFGYTTLQIDISDCTATLSPTAYTYDGKAKNPTVTVQYGATSLVSGTDYTVAYSANTAAGTATVTITGTGNYTGTLTKSFTISAKSINGFTAALPKNAVYTGSAIKPAITLKDGTKTLVGGTDYTATATNNVNAGTAKVTITGIGNYSGTITKNFTISAKSINGFTATQPKDVTYIGSAIKPAITLKNGSTTLNFNTDYTVTYLNNTKVGKVAVTIKGKGNYSGTITKNFKINPKNTTLTIAVGSKKATVKWTKVSGATGYELYRSTSSAGTYTKIKTTTTTSYTNTGLTKGKTYYYKIRTYQTVGGVKYYSEISTVKAVKVK